MSALFLSVIERKRERERAAIQSRPDSTKQVMSGP